MAGKMERVTISMEDDLLRAFDDYMSDKGYDNRSEGFRDAVRHLLAHEKDSDDSAACVGCVSYVYNHRERQLSSKLIETQHLHHEIPTATLHLHIDADHCVEATILSGPRREVRHMAHEMISQKGVRYGNLHIIPVK